MLLPTKVASKTQGRLGDEVTCPLCQELPIPFLTLLVKCFQGRSATCTLRVPLHGESLLGLSGVPMRLYFGLRFLSCGTSYHTSA